MQLFKFSMVWWLAVSLNVDLSCLTTLINRDPPILSVWPQQENKERFIDCTQLWSNWDCDAAWFAVVEGHFQRVGTFDIGIC